MRYTKSMRKTINGFTIIEMLVVITVIGIIAGITLVTYNGIQQRARTSQTVNAATQWIKGLMMYKARNGGLPTMSSCLGSGYLYDSSGTATSGTAQCYQNAGVNITVDSSFTTAMSKYMSGLPAPAMVSAVNSTSSWYRGLSYVVNSTTNTAQILFTLDSGQACPLKVGDFSRTYSDATSGTNTNMVCMYALGSTTSYDYS